MLVFILIIEESIQSFTIKYDVAYGFFIEALYQVEEIPLYYYFVECFFFLSWNGKIKIYFCQTFFWVFWNDHAFFVLYYCDILNLLIFMC